MSEHEHVMKYLAMFVCLIDHNLGLVAESKGANTAEPLLLNAVKGLDVERPPVWLMRQAGRYMKAGL